MANSADEQSFQKTLRELEKKIIGIRFWMAVVVLIGVLITTLATWMTQNKIEEIKIDIEKLTEKPLEGLWNYHSDYESLYDEPDPHQLIGSGKAIMIWKINEARYDVYTSFTSFKITKSAQKETPLLVISVKGILNADNNTGLPNQQQNFSMDNFRIIAHLHYKGLPSTVPMYTFSNCSTSSSGNRIDTIKCSLITPDSESKVTLTKLSSLH